MGERLKPAVLKTYSGHFYNRLIGKQIALQRLLDQLFSGLY
jgi:hypothetical protein